MELCSCLMQDQCDRYVRILRIGHYHSQKKRIGWIEREWEKKKKLKEHPNFLHVRLHGLKLYDVTFSRQLGIWVAGLTSVIIAMQLFSLHYWIALVNNSAGSWVLWWAIMMVGMSVWAWWPLLSQRDVFWGFNEIAVVSISKSACKVGPLRRFTAGKEKWLLVIIGVGKFRLGALICHPKPIPTVLRGARWFALLQLTSHDPWIQEILSLLWWFIRLKIDSCLFLVRSSGVIR